MPDIPPLEDSLPTASGVVPSTAAAAPEVSNEDEPYAISLKDRVSKECQIDELGKANAAAALEVLRDIGLTYRGPGTLKSCWVLETKRVRREGDYLQVCKKVDEEHDVMELVCVKTHKDSSRAVDIRIFYYSLSSNRTFYLLAIRKDHYNLDHSPGSRRD